MESILNKPMLDNVAIYLDYKNLVTNEKNNNHHHHNQNKYTVEERYKLGE